MAASDSPGALHRASRIGSPNVVNDRLIVDLASYYLLGLDRL